VPPPVKLSSPQTGEFWEIPVLFEDDHLLALNKPAMLAVSPNSSEPERASLLQLLHRDIERGAPWASSRGLGYLMNAHPLDAEASGALLLVKQKAALAPLADQFTAAPARRTYAGLVRGVPPADTFVTDAKLAPHPLQMGVVRVDEKEGKRSHTEFALRERFENGLLLEIRPIPDRPGQIRAHLRHLRMPLVGDFLYGGKQLFLSSLKPGYRLKEGHEEHPLMARPALHLERLDITHPGTGEKLAISAPPAKDLAVSIKYLRRFASGTASSPD
jgi:RluA family pseudouridine synthase